MQEIRVVSWGLGAMGSGMAELITTKKGIKIVGAVDKDPSKIKKDLGELFQNNAIGIKIQSEFDFSKTNADLVLLATSSFTKQVYPALEKAIKSGLNVITIAEEMAYTKAQNPDLASKIDSLARENNVTVVGTGINPGFLLDLLILTLTGVCLSVDKIEASRVNDLSPFGPTVMQTQGVGSTPEEFSDGLQTGNIVGHIGFQESINMIADTLGWTLDKIIETRAPIISKTDRQTKYIKIKPGMVAGCSHTAVGIVEGKEKIKLIHPQQICPEKEDIETGDYINIIGNPDIHLTIKPEIPGGKGTQAVAVNSIVSVFKAKAGLLTMKDLPVPYFLPVEFAK